MDRLPPEILHLILQALSKIEETRYDSAVSIMDIKALRLSCRTFADLGPEYLFHNVWLYMEEDSFAKLQALTKHRNYGRMVRVLKIFPNLLSGVLLVKEDYEKCVKGITFTGDSREKWGFDTDGRRELSQEQLDAGFLEYTQIYEHQVQVRTNADNLLHHALAAFAGLKSITIGFVDEVIEDAVCFDRCNKIQDIARKTLMANGCDGWKSGLYDREDAIMILTAIALSERKELDLDLTNDYGSFDTTLFDNHSNTLENIKKALVSLKSLLLDLRGVSPVHLLEVIDTGSFANFLEYAANLEYLHLANKPETALILFETIFCTAHWSSLKTFGLHGLMVNGNDLNGFFDRHSATLEKIHLSRMLLTSGSWKQVFAGMQGKQALKSFGTGNLFVGNVGSEQEVLSIPWDDAAHDDLLNAFIFGGEEWSPKLPLGYSQEAKWDDEEWMRAGSCECNTDWHYHMHGWLTCLPLYLKLCLRRSKAPIASCIHRSACQMYLLCKPKTHPIFFGTRGLTTKATARDRPTY